MGHAVLLEHRILRFPLFHIRTHIVIHAFLRIGVLGTDNRFVKGTLKYLKTVLEIEIGLVGIAQLLHLHGKTFA